MTIQVINPGGGSSSSGGIVANPNVPGLGFEPFARPLTLNNNALLVSQRLHLAPIWLPSGITVTSISFMSVSTALATGNHQIFGLYDNDAGSIAGGVARALLRGTTDDTSTAWAANSTKTLNLTSTYVTPTTGRYYVGILVDATTVPTIASTNAVGNAASGAAPSLGGPSSTTVTALPNPAAAISAAATTIPYFYLS